MALRVAGRTVARYAWRPDLPVTLSPRPHLHPVRTLAGTEVTEVRPADHVHHLGAGVAIADVSGRNFWGGRTYVPGRGPAWLDDHGAQLHERFTARGDGGFTETLSWAGPDGTVIMREERTVSARPLPGCWALDFAFTLTNTTGRPLKISSSAVKGRPGAGYGGFFWRAPGCATGRDVFTATAQGEAGTHGVTDPWLALTAATPRDDGEAAWSLVFVQAEETPEPWFVRISDYPGVGVALAWERALVVEDTLARRIVTVIADGRLTRARAAGLAAEALS
ncbi:PmoA family protein [Streptosporangium sp. KLBMP 9127]|nr:PmoA family protein [Streptosporangium sp. KLBMP 9127]